MGSGGLKCENSVPNFELEFHPDHWGGPIGPELCGPFKYVHQIWSASKTSHFRTFAPSTPSAKTPVIFAKNTVYVGLAKTIYIRYI